MTSAAIEMERLVRLAASPMIPGEQVPHAIARAARRLGIARGRVQSFWYGKARNCTPDELEAARAAAVQHAHDLELLRNEHRRALEILARIEARLALTDEGQAGPMVGHDRDRAGRTARAGDHATVERETVR